MAFSWLDATLNARDEEGYLRRRVTQSYEKDNIICIDGAHYLNFASNDYLGMRHHEGVLQAWTEGLAQYGGGSGASPLVTGHTQAHQALEAYLANHLKREAVLLFNSGFAANQAICQALFHHGGVILADKLMHASFLEGAQASKATLKRFAHNDVGHLERFLSGTTHQDTLIATEGIFSMDGDAAPVKTLANIAYETNAWLMIDDAHGFGVLGEQGFGTAEHHGLTQQQAAIVMGTFGKAIGTAGAFVAGSQALIDYLVNFARHYIYSTAMPSAQAVATLYSLTYLRTSAQRHILQQNIAYFRQKASDAGLTIMPSDSPIQPVIAGSPAGALALANGLKMRGIWAVPMRYPTVPRGTDRVRLTLNAGHTQRDIDALVDALALAMESIGA